MEGRAGACKWVVVEKGAGRGELAGRAAGADWPRGQLSTSPREMVLPHPFEVDASHWIGASTF